ncbi:hypothetical protein D3P06_05055 [Paracoccus aestuarii]|uniref:Uncharacterized protein n=1 Tax=Paracoccus aestuarii TaxID=453842 RepID=A0A418ZZW9_9RHOB|nr:hypothetical protein [Paracoccus aestuarii]RJL06030.1 hypothetical protein D3P06_05055 [Paracoccus aestuarii]WCQ99118.1 hypothetical protein JHW48_14980 [Paracoccus aestuarii]
MTAKEKLTARLAALTTEQLVEISIRMNLAMSNEETLVAIYAERELEKRMTAEEFAAHLEVLETMLDAAA